MLLLVRRVKERLGAIVPQGAAATAGGALFCGGISEWGGSWWIGNGTDVGTMSMKPPKKSTGWSALQSLQSVRNPRTSKCASTAALHPGQKKTAVMTGLDCILKVVTLGGFESQTQCARAFSEAADQRIEGTGRRGGGTFWNGTKGGGPSPGAALPPSGRSASPCGRKGVGWHGAWGEGTEGNRRDDGGVVLSAPLSPKKDGGPEGERSRGPTTPLRPRPPGTCALPRRKRDKQGEWNGPRDKKKPEARREI